MCFKSEALEQPGAGAGTNEVAGACFLDLPPELRNRVYHLALTKNNIIHLASFPGRSSKDSIPQDLILTCRHVRDDVTPIYYGNNTFSAASPEVAKRFLRDLRRQTIGSLRSFRPFASQAFEANLERWNGGLEAMRSNVNDLVKFHGKMALKMGAIYLPERLGVGGEIVHRSLLKVKVLQIEGVDGEWQVSWAMKREFGLLRFRIAKEKGLPVCQAGA